MAVFFDLFRRPASASTVNTTWSQNTSVSVGHQVPNRHIPVIKGDVNFVNTNVSEDGTDNDAVPSHYIKEILDRLSQLPVQSIDHEDALEFLYDLFYMHSLYNQDDSRIARLFIENNYCSIVHQCLMEYMTEGLFSSTSIRRSTQYILYTLWNFTGVSIEFRLYLSNQQSLIKFLLEDFLTHLIDSKSDSQHVAVIENLIQAIISILHNATLNIHHLNVEQTYRRVEQLLLTQEPTKANERFRITLLLCLINLHPKQVSQNSNGPNGVIYQSTLKLVFRFLKKIVQQEILMISTGLSAWTLTFAINKLPVEIILQEDNRLYSLMILFKRGMREEKLQAGLALSRCANQSSHAKEIMEKDSTCWHLFQQFKVFLDTEQTTS